MKVKHPILFVWFNWWFGIPFLAHAQLEWVEMRGRDWVFYALTVLFFVWMAVVL